MKANRKVIVGMSGGVDSSVTALLLKERGYEVEGVSFMLWEARERSDFTSCCSLDSFRSAGETAGQIGIPHSCIDVRGEFIEKVIEPFVAAYTKGLTPNPCILCNRHIKFPLLRKIAAEREAGHIATGHYAITGRTEAGNGAVMLRRGADRRKDQSYVLYALRPGEIQMLLLPLGEFLKDEVRAVAASHGLAASGRPESQEICFIGSGDYPAFIEDLCPEACRPGPIVDEEGRALGSHRGIFRYTPGQRKGLGIFSPEPYYVISVDAPENRVTVGRRGHVSARAFHADDLNWLTTPGGSAFRATVKVRSMMEPKPAEVIMEGDRVQVVFDEPQWAPAPGQSAVFYDGDMVLGGGIITQVFRLKAEG